MLPSPWPTHDESSTAAESVPLIPGATAAAIIFATRSKRAAFKIGGIESRAKHRSFVAFREPYHCPKVQRSGEKEPLENVFGLPSGYGSAEIDAANSTE
jgi:hypothetical protein